MSPRSTSAPAADDLAQDDAAAVEREGEGMEPGADVVLLHAQGVGELVGRDRVRGEEEQRLELAFQAHATAAAMEPPLSARTVMGPKGTSCSHAASPRL